MTRRSVLALALALSVSAQFAVAQPAAALKVAADAPKNMQGDQASWIADPHMHAFYDLSVRTFRGRPAVVDEAAYTADAVAIFRDFATSRGLPPEKMVDHLRLIPHQVIGIVREDPTVLATYASFIAALFGPQS